MRNQVKPRRKTLKKVLKRQSNLRRETVKSHRSFEIVYTCRQETACACMFATFSVSSERQIRRLAYTFFIRQEKIRMGSPTAADQNLDSILREDRVFPPPPEFAA